MKQKVYTLKLPIDLMHQIETITKNKSEFITLAVQQALYHDFLQSGQSFRESSDSTNQTDEYLNRYIDRLEADVEFWKDKYEVLQLEYYDAVKDSIKRIDSKFERVMYSIDESKTKPLFESVSLTSKTDKDQNQKNMNISDLKKKNPGPAEN
jgi:hypothetical protein